MLETDFCRLLDVELPIANAPIGTAAGPELAAAVSNAGGLGMLAASFLRPPDEVRAAIRAVRRLTSRPFAVNLLLEWPQEERLEVCLEERVPVISLFWGDPSPRQVEAIHEAGARWMHSVGSADEAARAAAAGADVVLAQGWEAGGHVRGEIATMALIPRVVDATRPTPVAAAGGIADGRGAAAALTLGASAVVLGTRFVASRESAVPAVYRDCLVAADTGDTVFGETFDVGWPSSNMRTLVNSTMRGWLAAGRPPPGKRPGEHEVVAFQPDGRPIVRYSVTQPAMGLEGDLEALALYSGQGVGLVRDVPPAGEVVRRIANETVEALRHAQRLMAQETTRT